MLFTSSTLCGNQTFETECANEALRILFLSEADTSSVERLAAGRTDGENALTLAVFSTDLI